MKKFFITGLLGVVLSGCFPSIPRYLSSVEDATNFTYYADDKRFFAYVTSNKCDKPCQIVIEEYRSIQDQPGWILTTTWFLNNYGNKVPYAVKKVNAIDGSVNDDLKEIDVDRQAIPMDTLRSRFYFK